MALQREETVRYGVSINEYSLYPRWFHLRAKGNLDSPASRHRRHNYDHHSTVRTIPETVATRMLGFGARQAVTSEAARTRLVAANHESCRETRLLSETRKRLAVASEAASCVIASLGDGPPLGWNNETAGRLFVSSACVSYRGRHPGAHP